LRAANEIRTSVQTLARLFVVNLRTKTLHVARDEAGEIVFKCRKPLPRLWSRDPTHAERSCRTCDPHGELVP